MRDSNGFVQVYHTEPVKNGTSPVVEVAAGRKAAFAIAQSKSGRLD